MEREGGGAIGKKELSSSGADGDDEKNRRSRSMSMFRRENSSNDGNDKKQERAPSSSFSKHDPAAKSQSQYLKSKPEGTNGKTNANCDDETTTEGRRSYSVPKLSISNTTTMTASSSASPHNSNCNSSSNSNAAHHGHHHGFFDFGTVTVVPTNNSGNFSAKRSRSKSEFQRKFSNGTHDTNPLSVASSTDSSLDKSGKSSNSVQVHSILDASDRSAKSAKSAASSKKSRGSGRNHGTAPTVSTVGKSSTTAANSIAAATTAASKNSKNTSQGMSTTRNPTGNPRSKSYRSSSIQKRRSSNRTPVLRPPPSPPAMVSVYSGINRHGVVIRKEMEESDDVILPEEYHNVDDAHDETGRNVVGTSRPAKREPEETGTAASHHRRVGNANCSVNIGSGSKPTVISRDGCSNNKNSNNSNINSVKCVLCMKEIINFNTNSKSNSNAIHTVGKFHYHAECLRKSRGANDLDRMTQAYLKKSKTKKENSNRGLDCANGKLVQTKNENAAKDNESSRDYCRRRRRRTNSSKSNNSIDSHNSNSDNSIGDALFRDSATADTPVNNYYISPDYVIDNSCSHEDSENGGTNHLGRRRHSFDLNINDSGDEDDEIDRATTDIANRDKGNNNNSFSNSKDKHVFGTNPYLCRFYGEQIAKLRSNDPAFRGLSSRITRGAETSQGGSSSSKRHSTSEKDVMNIAYILSLEAWERIGYYVSRNDKLDTIDFSNCDYTDDNSSSNNHFGDEEMSIFFKAACNNESVRSLNLANNTLGVNGITSLASFLKRNQRLETLNLSGCATMRNEGFELLVKALHESPIRELNVTDCGISNISALKDVSLPNLTHLQLSSNNIGLDGCKTLSKWLRTTNTDELRTLHLQNGQINDGGAKILSLALSGNTALTDLYLTDNTIESRGRAAFLNLVCNMTNIENVFKSNHTLQYIHLDELTSPSRSNEFLQQALDINRSFHGDASAVCLAKVNAFHKKEMAVLQNENKEKGERIEELIAENTILKAAAAAEKSEDESAKTTTPNDSHRELEDLRAQNKTLSEHNTTMEKKFQYLSEAVDSISLVTTQNMSIERKLLDEIVELKAITAELNAENEDLMAENQQLIELLSERDAELARIRDNPRTPIGYTAESDDDDEDDDDFWDDMSHYTTSTSES